MTCIRIFRDVQIAVGIDTLPSFLCFLQATAMCAEQADKIVYIYPYFRKTFFLTFFKNQLHTEVQVYLCDIINIFPVRVSCSTHKSQKVTGLNNIALLQPLGKRLVFL